MTTMAAGQPNILLIMGDHATWDMVAGRSPARTPNLDRLAAEGLLFERSYTPVSVCCPARAMLATGGYPWRSGIFNQVHVPQSLNPDMRPDAVTFAAGLRDAGYRTGYLGKWHASWERGPLDFGYDEFGGVANPKAPYVQRHGLADEDNYQLYRAQYAMCVSGQRTMHWPGTQEPFVMWATDEGPGEATHMHFLAERATQMIGRFGQNQVYRGQPWHLEVHFPEPHDPYTPLRRFVESYRADDIDLPRSYYLETFAGKPGMHTREAGLWAELDEDDVRDGRRHFYAYCEQLDHYIGRVLQAVETTGQSRQTLVVFASDHGDLLGAHRMFLKGWMPYEEAHRIPMIARWPGVITPGGRTDALVQLHDWAHTFLAAAGAEPLPYDDGADLSPLLIDPAAAGRDSILNVYYGAEFLYTQRILISHRFKYVFNGFDADEFYDLERDPDELHNVINHPAYRSHVHQTREQLWEKMRQLGDPYAHGNRYGAARYLPHHTSPGWCTTH